MGKWKKNLLKNLFLFFTTYSQRKIRDRQATIDIDGTIYKTTPIAIEVTAAVDKPSDEKTADDIADESLHLVAEVSNASPYLNEAISVVYKLFISPTISISDIRHIDKPTYVNFWNQDIPVQRLQAENGSFNGKPYRYVVLKRMVLYPQKTGKLTIEPLSIGVFVDVPTNRVDFFGQRIYTQVEKVVSAGSRTIQVKELPQEGKPSNFTGAVGNFDFKVTTTRTDLKASESLQAKVEVSGNGNLKLFELPKLQLPTSLEVYDPEFKESINTTLVGMQGRVSDNYTVVPQNRGKYPIPSISFSYFNPQTRKYHTVQSDEIVLNVYEGPEAITTTPSTTTGGVKQSVLGGENQFRFLKLKPGLIPVSSYTFFGTMEFYMWWLLPILFIPFVMLVWKKKQAIDSDVQGNKIRAASKLAKKYLGAAKKKLGHKETFYEALERALHNYLKARLHIETSEFSKEKIIALLQEKGVKVDNVNEFTSLLASCEQARYAPASQTAMEHDYERAVDVISLIDKQL